MTVLHSGTTKKYSDNWSQVFGPAPAAGAASAKAAKKASASSGTKKKKAPAKKADKKAGKR